MWFEIKNLLKTSLKSLSRNRTRSFLTSLGIIIGVGAVVIMVGIGTGARMEIEKSIRSLGSNVIMIRPARTRVGGVSKGASSFNRLTLKDSEAVKNKSMSLKAVSPVIRSSGQVIGNGKNWATSVYGVTNDYLVIKEWDLKEGLSFTEREQFSRKKVALLGKTVADELFSDNSPIGETIRIRNIPFQVIGVLDEKGQGPMGDDQDDIILIPATTALYRLKGGNYIDMIYCSAREMGLIPQSEDEIKNILRDTHRLREGEEDDFELRNQSEIIERASSMSKTMTMLLAAVAAVSLLVGGIGIMNIMLVSVTERTREIGTRMAVGARKSDILIQFLTESIILSAFGGILGILFAYSVSMLLSEIYGFSIVIEYWIVSLSLLFAALVGIFFGIYPASKASSLNPIEALRYE